MKLSAARLLTPRHSKRDGVGMLMAYVRAYPGRSATAMLAVFVAGLLDGLGLSMLLSMLTLASKNMATETPSLPERLAIRVAEMLGLQPTAMTLLILAIVLITFKAILTLLANRQVGYTVAYIATNLRLGLIRAVMDARWSHYLQQSAGRLSNAVASEAQRASEAFQHGSEMMALLLNSVIYLGIALSISAPAGLAAIVAGGVLLLLLQSLIRYARRAGQNQTDLLMSLVTVIGAQLAAAKPLKAMAREAHVDALLVDQMRRLKRALRQQVYSKEALTALLEPLLAIMVGLGFFFSLVVLKMPITLVLLLVFLLGRVVGYLSKALRAYQHVVLRESAYWSLIDAIEKAHALREPHGGERRVALTREIRFEAASFSHGGQNTLDRQSFTIDAGILTAVVGPSGSGKTTLLDLVVGLLHPTEGRILVDGVPMDELDMRAWRGQIGYVPQESAMVDESVAFNLTLGENLPEAAIREALRKADALEFVDALPEGMHTRIGENGSRLSGGQRQRLAIARALIHEPRLLILDEATSNLDPEAQSAVIETIRHLKGKLTMIAVAHQGRLIEAADCIYHLSGGKITKHKTGSA